MNQYTLAGLDKFKDYLKDTSDTNNSFYQDLIGRASKQIERITKRNLRARSYTEYYDGNGSNTLFLNHYPIVGTTADIDLYDDIDRNFTSTYKFDDDDWVLYSDEGYIELLHDSSIGAVFQKGIQNVKITYTAGYDDFTVVTGYNDAIDFNEGGSELNATLSAGTYTAATLCTEIDTQLEDAGTDDAYTVAYNNVTCKFIITKASGTFQILWNSGTNAATNATDLLGFVSSADDTGALTYTSDYSRPGVPDDLEQACILLAYDYYLKSKNGEDRFGKKSVNSEMGTLAYKENAIPDEVTELLRPYIRANI